MTGTPTHRIWLHPPAVNKDITGAPATGPAESFPVMALRREIAGRRDATGEVIFDEATVLFRFAKHGVEDISTAWTLSDEDYSYIIESVLRDRQYPDKYWEARCSTDTASGSTRFSRT